MKYKLILLIAGITLLTEAQDTKSYFLTAETSIGLSRHLSSVSMNGLNKNGINFSAALYWQPEHLLEIGLETGYSVLNTLDADIYSEEYGTGKADAILTALPIRLIFRMEVIDDIKLHAGSGILLLFNDGEIYDEKFSSSQISITDFIGISYKYMFWENVAIGGSLSYNYLFKLEESFITLQATFAYHILKW